MQVTHTIKVNLQHPWRAEEIYVKQGDINSRLIKVEIYNGASPWSVPGGTVAEFHAYKPDNTFCDIDATISGNAVFVLLDEQVTAVPGPVKAEVTLTNGGEVLNTFLVYINVQIQAVPDGAIESQVEITAYREIVEQISEIVGDAEDITDQAEAIKNQVELIAEQVHVMQGAPLVAATVAEMTDTDRVYVYTGSEAGYTAGSWYYFDGAVWTLGGVYNSVAVQTDPTLTLEGQAADSKTVGDRFAGIDEVIDLEDRSFTEVIISIPMEKGGLNATTAAKSTTSSNRARTVADPSVVSLACSMFYFPEGTKHRFALMTRTNTLIRYTDWSNLSVDDLSSYITNNENFVSGLFLKILVGYQDDRTITDSNVPPVYIKYKLTKATPYYRDFSLSVNYNGIFRTDSAANNTYGVWSISPIIPVEYGKTYRASSIRNTIFLDEDLNFVSSIAGPDQTIDKTITITNPDIKYILYTYHTDTGVNYFEEADKFIGAVHGNDSVPYALNGMKLSLLGDSISAYTGTIPEGNDVYYNGSNSGVIDPAQMWWDVLCNRLGMVPLVINGYSGSGVTQLEDVDHLNKVPMSSDARCAALDDGVNNPDIILIAGGVNDYSYAMSAQSEPLAWNGKTTPVITNNFTEAYACMIKKLQTNYPDAIVVALSTWFTMRGTDNGYTLTHTVSGTSNVYTQADYNAAIESIAKQMHIPYIDVSCIGINRNNMYPTYAEDSSTVPTHPNAKGQRLMGEYLATKLPIVVNGYNRAR